MLMYDDGDNDLVMMMVIVLMIVMNMIKMIIR